MIRRSILALTCVLAVPGALRAQTLEDYDYEHLSFRGVGLDISYIYPTKVESTTRYGMRFDLGFLGPGVRIMPSIGYWSSELKRGELERLADQFNRLEALRQRGVTVRADELGTIEWSSVSLGLDGQYAWDTDLGLTTYLGTGLAVHVLNGSGDAIAGTFVEDLLDTITAGLAVSSGFEFEPISRFRVYIEGNYTVLNHLRYPGFKVGGAMVLP